MTVGLCSRSETCANVFLSNEPLYQALPCHHIITTIPLRTPEYSLGYDDLLTL